jgi:hypothetical protein
MSMQREPIWRRYLRFWGPAPSADIEDEFAFHMQAKVDELVAAGYSPEDARQEAKRRFGQLKPLHRECLMIRQQQDVKASRAVYFAGWFRDLQYALRVLSRSKTIVVAAVLILALGIGGTTAVFTLLDRLIFKPLPVPHPAELALVRPMEDGEETAFRYRDYLFLRDNNSTLAGLSGSGMFRMVEEHGQDEIAKPAEANPVTGNYFDTLGVKAAFGRTLTPADDSSNVSHVAVASHRFAVSRNATSRPAASRTLSCLRA